MNYDPRGIITKISMEKNNYAYDYHPRLELESLSNKKTWEEVQEYRRKLREQRDRILGQKMGTKKIIHVMEVYECE